MSNEPRRRYVDSCLSEMADRLRSTKLSGELVHRVVAIIQVLAGIGAISLFVAFLAVASVRQSRDPAAAEASEDAVLAGLIYLAASVGARQDDLPRYLRRRPDPATGRLSRYATRSKGGATLWRPCAWTGWGLWPVGLAAASILVLFWVPFLPHAGHPPPSGVAATVGLFGLSCAVLAYGDRKGRPLITALAVLLAVVAKLPSARTATWLAIPALLFVVIGLIALMVSLLNISKIVNRRQTSKADAIVVGFGLGLLVAFGGPPLYAVLGLGQVAEARNGAQGVAGSLIASALFFAFGPQRSEPD